MLYNTMLLISCLVHKFKPLTNIQLLKLRHRLCSLCRVSGFTALERIGMRNLS